MTRGSTQGVDVCEGNMMTRSGTLVRDWRQASLSSSWSQSEQWWTPAVDAVADAIVGTTGNPRAACETLGRQRAAAGVFLDEARADVLVAARIAGLGSASTAQLIDGLTIGWVDRTLDSYFTSACIDPITELASLPYLMTRLSEIYAGARARDADVADEHAFVVVQVVPSEGVLESEMHMVVVQNALRCAFNSGETLARVGPFCAVAVVSRSEPDLSSSLGALRTELETARAEQRLPPTRMWLERLPGHRADLPAAVRQLKD
jgi:hypothetical protein